MAENTGIVQIQALNYMIHSKTLDLVYDFGLTEDHFFDYKDEFLYIIDHYKEYGCVPDEVSFFDKFRECDNVPVSDSPEYLASRLTEEAAYRDALDPLQGEDGLHSGMLGGKTLEAIKSFIPRASAILQKYDISERHTSFKECFEDWLLPDKAMRIRTGFITLDDQIIGVRKGDLTFVQGATGLGKTWILSKMASTSMKDSRKVLFYSDEMAKDVLAKRIFAFVLKAPFDIIDAGALPKKTKKKLETLSSDVSLDILDMSDTGADTLDGLEMMIDQKRPDVVYIDGITYMRSRRIDTDKEFERLTQVSVELTRIAKKYDCAIVVAVQSNREATKFGSSRSSIGSSYGMLQIASLDIILNRENDFFVLSCGKNRHGKEFDTVVYSLDFEFMDFVPVSKEMVDCLHIDQSKIEVIDTNGNGYSFKEILERHYDVTDSSLKMKMLREDGSYSNFYEPEKIEKYIKKYDKIKE